MSMMKNTMKMLTLVTASMLVIGGGLLTAEPAQASTGKVDGYTLAEARDLIFKQTNDARKAKGLKPLTRSGALENIAQDWANQQAKNQVMAHRPNFTKPYPAGWRWASENVAMGYHVSKVTKGWLDSPGHYANIMHASTNAVGIGVAVSSKGYPYYTQNFGQYNTVPSPIPAVTPPPKPAPKPTAPIKTSGDVIAVDKAGKLWNYGNNATRSKGRVQIGSGWNGFKKVHNVDWNGDGIQDVLGQATNGSLSVYLGKSNGGFQAAKKVGSSGWASMKIMVGKWTKTDKYPSVIARDTAGKLWQYPRSNDISMGARKQVGTGWGSFVSIIAVDSNNDKAIDLIAKTKTGDLMLYATNGNGSFQKAKKVGSGWKAYKISGYVNYGAAGTSSIIATDGAGKLWNYPVKGNAIQARVNIGSSGWSAMNVGNNND